MPDMVLHQGASLHCDTPDAGLRLLVVLSQPHADALDTLWQVCAQLQRLGYPVIVLDGTSAESDATPGLAHLLAQGAWGNGALPAMPGGDALSLAVLPALHGLADLAAGAGGPAQALAPLHTLFRSYALVVLHAPVAVLASALLEGLGTTPLLVLQPGPEGVLDGYRQLKQLALHTGLNARVASVAQPHDAAQERQARGALQAVSACAARHLGQRIGSTLLHSGVAADLQQLALQLLESAGTLQAAGPPGSWHPALAAAPQPLAWQAHAAAALAAEVANRHARHHHAQATPPSLSFQPGH